MKDVVTSLLTGSNGNPFQFNNLQTNTMWLQFSPYSPPIDLTASTEQRYRRTQSYDPVVKPCRQASRICISACHQHTNVDTSYVIQLNAAGPPCRGNRIGPRTEHCGSPNFTAAGCELELPQRTCCMRPSRYEANQAKTESPKSYDVRRRCKSVEWSTVSKAADKSSNVRTARSPRMSFVQLFSQKMHSLNT